MDKRGTHVGVVISFIMFVTFLLFLNTFLIDPVTKRENKQILLENLKTKIIENASNNMTSASLNINNNDGNKCVSLQNFMTNAAIGSKIVVKNKDETVQSAYTQTNNLVIDRDNHDYTFFKIYAADEFDPIGSKSGCKEVTESGYAIGIISSQKYVSPSKVIDLVNAYKSNYNALKSNFSLVGGDEFSFSFIYSNNSVFSTGEKNVTTSIYSIDIPVQYFDTNANISLATIRIKVW